MYMCIYMYIYIYTHYNIAYHNNDDYTSNDNNITPGAVRLGEEPPGAPRVRRASASNIISKDRVARAPFLDR